MKGVCKGSPHISSHTILEQLLLENQSLKLQLCELHKITLRLLQRCQKNSSHASRRHKRRFDTSTPRKPGCLTTWDIERLARCFADDDDEAPPLASTSLPTPPNTPLIPVTNTATPLLPCNPSRMVKSAPATPQTPFADDDHFLWDDDLFVDTP